MCPALNAEAGGGGYSSQMYPVPAERRVRRVIEPERPHRRRHAWHGADDPRIVPSLRRCTQAVCLPPIAEQGCPHAVTIFIEARDAPIDRKSVVKGKSGPVRVDLGGRRHIKKKKKKKK